VQSFPVPMRRQVPVFGPMIVTHQGKKVGSLTSHHVARILGNMGFVLFAPFHKGGQVNIKPYSKLPDDPYSGIPIPKS
jgi:hypothetical protein